MWKAAAETCAFVQSQRLEHIGACAQEFVEQTKENSGLDFDKLNKQPGFASDKNVGTSPAQAVCVKKTALSPCLLVPYCA